MNAELGLDKLKNPYTGRVVTKRVTANVGVDEWNAIVPGVSLVTGYQDKLVSMLIKKFYELTKGHLPDRFDSLSEQQVCSAIARLTLEQPPRTDGGQQRN